jgi:D-arabinose 1-dehydrogenase-like Zn-dependent alcohol dehydrogenase
VEALAASSLPGATPSYELVGEGTNGVVIFGCGQLGTFALEGAGRAGLNVSAFADNNQKNWGTRNLGDRSHVSKRGYQSIQR